MGFFSNIAGALVKTASLPIAAAVDVATLGKADLTKRQVESITEDLDDALSGE